MVGGRFVGGFRKNSFELYLFLLFIANSKTKIHTMFLMLFNCTSSFFLGFANNLKKLRRFIETKKTSLYVAAEKGDIVFCKLLLCDGAIVDSADIGKQTPLYVAASRGHSDVCNLLINFGASVNKAVHSNQTVLLAAVDGGHVDVCKLLIDQDAMVDGADDCKTYNPLHRAVIHGNTDICELLIKKGARVNKVDDRDRTPLFVAADAGLADVCKLLEHHGADISCMEKTIESLLGISSSEMKKLLLRWKDELGKRFNSLFC